MLMHVTQRLRDKRDIAAARAAPVAELEGQGKTILEDASHYADEEALYVSAANRADGEPATESDANAYVIQRNWQGHHSAKPVINEWKELGFTPRHERYAGGRQAQSGPMTEEQKAERKTLIANNKAMESAGIVRREFVKNLLVRKQAPKGWQYFTVYAITHHPETASGYQGEVAADMIGAKTADKNGRWGWNPSATTSPTPPRGPSSP